MTGGNAVVNQRGNTAATECRALPRFFRTWCSASVCSAKTHKEQSPEWENPHLCADTCTIPEFPGYRKQKGGRPKSSRPICIQAMLLISPRRLSRRLKDQKLTRSSPAAALAGADVALAAQRTGAGRIDRGARGHFTQAALRAGRRHRRIGLVHVHEAVHRDSPWFNPHPMRGLK